MLPAWLVTLRDRACLDPASPPVVRMREGGTKEVVIGVAEYMEVTRGASMDVADAGAPPPLLATELFDATEEERGRLCVLLLRCRVGVVCWERLGLVVRATGPCLFEEMDVEEVMPERVELRTSEGEAAAEETFAEEEGTFTRSTPVVRRAFGGLGRGDPFRMLAVEARAE